MSAAPSREERLSEFRKKLENRLNEIGLSKAQIETHPLSELEQHLVTINELIANPKGLDNDFEIEISFLSVKTNVVPVLLERKKFILDRISVLKSQEKITNLRELVSKKVLDEDIRNNLINQIDQLETEAQKLREQTSKVEDALTMEKVKREAELTKVEVLKQRSLIWLTFLERESVATITGAILLFMLTFTQIIIVFSEASSNEVLNNAFLLILGYFFGQSVSRASSRGGENA